MNLNDSVRKISGIGEQKSVNLGKLNIYTIEDLLNYYPKKYIDRRIITDICELEEGETYTIQVEVQAIPENIKIRNMMLTKVGVSDKTGKITLVWFQQPYMKNNFIKGQMYLVTGKVIKKYDQIQIENPEWEKVGGEQLSAGRIVPVYSLAAGVTQYMLKQTISSALKKLSGQIYDYLPESIIIDYNLCSLDFAIRNIHFPKDDESFFIARKRLVFDELFMVQISLFKLKGHVKKYVGHIFSDTDEHSIDLPFELTSAQKRVINEVKTDMASGYMMNRLIQGDVGSGKTVVAMIAAQLAIQNGYQVAIMAPTEVLATQHVLYFEKYFPDTVILTGSLTKKEKRRIYDKIELGLAKIIVGTHALIEDVVTYQNLGLVITDEQHRFGVRQRLALSEKGDYPHVLVMTATPIPRTLALILYGDMDISIIDELPPGRQKIETYAVTSAYYNRIYDFIKKELADGRQVYVVCSIIEESETKNKQAAVTYTEQLSEIFDEYVVECMHGKMRPSEKQYIMDRFKDNEIHVLVSTTVIEVGINVPNATIMLIENAEQFGLSQLHQLRGRVGRGSDKSYCILISDSKNKTTKERLSIMQKTSDGFVIAEKDLQLRGQGDFFGTKQHGIPEMRIANLYKDSETLNIARSMVSKLLNQETSLSDSDKERLLEKINSRFQLENDAITL